MLRASLLEKKGNFKARNGKLSLLRTLLSLSTGLIIFTGIMSCVWEVLKLVQPILLGYVMNYFDPANDSVSKNAAYIYGSLLVFLAFMQCFPPILFMHINQLIAIRVRAAVSSVIYRKILRLNHKSLSSITSGKIVNLISTDVEKFQLGLVYLHFLWIAPITLSALAWLLYTEVEISCISGFGLVFLLTPMNYLTSRTLGRLRHKCAQWTDKRALMMNQFINGMRVIKMYCWEIPFAKLVKGFRREEIKCVQRALGIKGQNEAMTFNSGKLTACSILLTHYLLGNDIKADTVVRVILWTEEVRLILDIIYKASQFGAEMMASLERIQEFFKAEELQPVPSLTIPGHIKLTNLVARWYTLNNTSQVGMGNEDTVTEIDRHMNHDHSLFDNISLMINPGELVAIVGAVGAGKSSLLMTMLGEMPVKSGSVNMAGKVAYVPQEAWIFSGSVQDNILFGQRYDHERFQNIINATALDKDLETFEHGSQSIVGENGHYLSGGQKARINLARAIYQNADIYLLDDPLSAVDSKVARYLFQRCIRGELEGKTRVLVTHQLQFLKQVDNIIVMDEGRILASGSYGQVSLHPDIGEIFRLHDRVLKNDRNMTLRRLSVISLNGHELEEKTIVKEESKPRSSTEEISIGSVGFSAYCQYFSAGNGIILFPLYLLFTMGYQVIFNMTDWILIRWNKNNTDGNFIYILAGLILGLVVSGSLRSLCFFLMASNSSRNLHNKMFGYLTRAPISFFDSNPAGRILNRFTRDTGFMDDILPQSLHTVFLFLMKFAGVVVFVSISNPWSLLITAPIFMFIMFLRRYCLKTMRDLKRLEASCRSPMFSHLSTTLQGLMVIRAFKMEKKFIDTFYAHQDLHTSAWQMFLSAFRWFSLKLDWCITLYLTGYIFAAFVLSNTGGDGAYLGLSLSYIVSLLGVFQYTMRLTAEVESYMTSVERILHYTKLDQEAAEHTSVQPDPDWPANGTIHFDHLYLSYTHGQYVLKDINIIIDKGEKIGIVGRTGAGKTSLLSCLFRLCEPSKGKIWMDGIDIGTLGLVDLRKKISIIPQDPVLFQATLRYNLDPFSEHSDESIWKALEEVELSSLMKTYGSGLESNIAESGSSLSVGQKQLVCLARAILRNNKILVIDEATANVDLSTDRCIQAALKRRFKNCTVLCIAHRINTVIDCDRILVLDQGEISQFGAPYALLQDQESIFYEMVHQTGKGISQMLYSIARNCYEEKLNGKLTEENEMTDDITLSRNTTCVGAEVSDELSADLDITGFANLAFVNDESIATYL